GQFDDLSTPGMRMLHDDEQRPPRPPESAQDPEKESN
ncbi:MAG: cbb3-type cytochrome oxidase assembly protein, partial [Deltaproteobacteria bacterium]|nr:cbb3-type cytochrome oxidase assembly protein [Deltaproteobacteria bacterium]